MIQSLMIEVEPGKWVESRWDRGRIEFVDGEAPVFEAGRYYPIKTVPETMKKAKGMNTTELGVYILGGVALALLAYAGNAFGEGSVLLCAVLSAGAAYVSQVFAALSTFMQDGHKDGIPSPALFVFNLAFMAVALLAWCVGVWLLAF